MIYRFGGHLKNATSPADWKAMEPVQAIRSKMTPECFDRGYLGRKYNVQLNAHVEWCEDAGLAVTVERLPFNPTGVLHKGAVAQPVEEYLADHWDVLITLPSTHAVDYTVSLCDPAPQICTLLNTRILEEQYELSKAKGSPLVETLSRSLRCW